MGSLVDRARLGSVLRGGAKVFKVRAGSGRDIRHHVPPVMLTPPMDLVTQVGSPENSLLYSGFWQI